MKKLIVLLLAFAMVGAVSAQVTTAIAASGEIDIIDQDLAGAFADDGAGYDTITFKATEKEGKFGISVTEDNYIDGIGAPRDWTTWYKGKFTKVSIGNLRNGDYRLTLPNWYTNYGLGGNDRISGYGMLIQATPAAGLSVGVNLPYPTAGEDTLDTFKKADLGVKYDIKDVGTAVAMANLNLVDGKTAVNVGFKFTGMKDLTAVALFKYAQQAKDGATVASYADVTSAGLAFAYSGVEKLAIGLEGTFTTNGQTTTKAWSGVAAYDVRAKAVYSVTDALSATLGGTYTTYARDGIDYDAFAQVAYDYGNGLSSEATVGFNGDFHAALVLYYGVSL